MLLLQNFDEIPGIEKWQVGHPWGMIITDIQVGSSRNNIILLCLENRALSQNCKLTKNSRSPVIGVVNKDPISSRAVNDLSTSTLHRTLVPKKHRIQVLSCNILASVILKPIIVSVRPRNSTFNRFYYRSYMILPHPTCWIVVDFPSYPLSDDYSLIDSTTNNVQSAKISLQSTQRDSGNEHLSLFPMSGGDSTHHSFAKHLRMLRFDLNGWAQHTLGTPV